MAALSMAYDDGCGSANGDDTNGIRIWCLSLQHRPRALSNECGICSKFKLCEAMWNLKGITKLIRKK